MNWCVCVCGGGVGWMRDTLVYNDSISSTGSDTIKLGMSKLSGSLTHVQIELWGSKNLRKNQGCLFENVATWFLDPRHPRKKSLLVLNYWMFMRSLDQDNLVLTTHNQEEELGKPKLSGMPIHIQIKLRRSKNSKKKSRLIVREWNHVIYRPYKKTKSLLVPNNLRFRRSPNQDNLVITTHNQEGLRMPKLSGTLTRIQIELRRSKNSRKNQG
jgi:hypothetical protein